MLNLFLSSTKNRNHSFDCLTPCPAVTIAPFTYLWLAKPFLSLCLCTCGSLYLECSLSWLFAPFRFHLKCQLLSEAFIYCSTKMDLVLFFPFSMPLYFFLINDSSPHPHSPQPALLQTSPISGNDPTQLLKSKTSVLLITLIWPHTHIQFNHSPNSSVPKIYPKCNHFPHSPLPSPYSGP